MTDLPPDVEQQLADMSDSDYDLLTARVRNPDGAETLRTAAAAHIQGDQLESFLSIAKTSLFVDDQGAVDEAKLQRTLRTLFDIPTQPRWADFGQHDTSGAAAWGPRRGAAGRAEAHKRFAINSDDDRPTSHRSSGAAEAQRRFGRKEHTDG